MSGPVFISFSSKDRKEALAICVALEDRGVPCWISARDIGPGENFQEAIVGTIKRSRAMVLVFSGNANNSVEIMKELALASAARIVVIPVRTEDVVPTGAYQYELATRQWVDLFTNWDDAIRSLADRIQRLDPGTGKEGDIVVRKAAGPGGTKRRRRLAGIMVVVPVLIAAVVVGVLLWPLASRQGNQVSAPNPAGGASRSEPASAKALMAAGDAFAAADQFAAASAEYRKAIEADGHDVAARRQLILVLRRQLTHKAFPPGNEAIDIALRRDYANFSPVDDDELNAVLKQIDDLQSVDPTAKQDPGILLNEALVLKTNGGRAKEAIPLLQQAQAAAPNDPEILAELGLLQAVLLEDTPATRDHALDLIRQAIRLKPAVALYSFYLARSLSEAYLCPYAGLDYMGTGDAEGCADAIRAFRKAAEGATSQEGWLRHRAQQGALDIFHRYARKERDILTRKLAMPLVERLEQLRFIVPAGVPLARNGDADNPILWEAILLDATGQPAEGDAIMRSLLKRDFENSPPSGPTAYWGNPAYVRAHPDYFSAFAKILADDKADPNMLAKIQALTKGARAPAD